MLHKIVLFWFLSIVVTFYPNYIFFGFSFESADCDALPENQRSYSQAEGISTATSPQVLLSAARSSPVVQ